MFDKHPEGQSSHEGEPMPPKKESSSTASAGRARASKLKKWASEHKWEILWGLLFALLVGRFVFPPEHKPYWVRVIQYSTTDDATARHFKALKREWNENPPRLGDVPVKLDLIALTDADETALDQKAGTFMSDEDTLLVIGHLPTGLTKRSLPTFMRANPPIPYIATSASADDLCENCDGSQDDSRFLPWLQPSPSNSKEAESMLLFAKQQKKSHCLVVTDKSSPAEAYSDELAHDISHLAEQRRDISIVDTVPMGAGQVLDETVVHQRSPDCVLYAGNADIALTLWRSLPASNQWLLVSDGVIETNKPGDLVTLPTESVFFAYATNATDAAKSVFASDAVGIARTLLEDLNRRGGNLFYRLRASIHLESVQSARINLGLVMRDNSRNRAWYRCKSSWDGVCVFDGNRRQNGLFHVWQQDETNHTTGDLTMNDVDGWHPPTQLDVVRLASSKKTN
jgi:hypothetical protein